MLELADVRAPGRAHSTPASLTHMWRHADPRVDALQQNLERLVGSRVNAPREEVFARVWEVAHAAAGAVPPARAPLVVARGRPVPERALVLLSGAHHRAGGSDMSGCKWRMANATCRIRI